MNKYINLFLTICLILVALWSQASDTIITKGIILRCSEKKIQSITSMLNVSRSFVYTYENLGIGSDLFLLTGGNDDRSLYEYCSKSEDIQALEYNFKLQSRIKPNDPKVTQQYYLELIQAYQSWDLVRDGKNFKNKDIVIGVIDEGYEISHEDLKENIYTNADETPGDGIDNDGNGYKDDINGWNIKNNSGTHDVRSHGTQVIGVIGAKGNNNLGISGINWNIKILPLTIGNFVSDVIKGYQFLLAEKTAYISSGGTKGANIMVTNYSGGLPNAFANDHPIWCGVYESLGLQGVLNVVSTTNADENVEIVGDMPSLCTSDYLLVVNSTNKADEKDGSTGYGNKSVDISAPGESILTTDIGIRGKYRTESGTSLSTSMVAGAAALLFSIKCDEFHNLMTTDPKSAVLKVKDALIIGVDKKNSLTGKTVSEGRMNILKSLKILINDNCSQELAPVGDLKINSVRYDAGNFLVDYISPNTNGLILNIISSDGKLIYTTKFSPPLLGNKQFAFSINSQLPGLYYYCSLIAGKNIASKGFTVQDVSK